jgi:heterodisulfide reductase subunit C
MSGEIFRPDNTFPEEISNRGGTTLLRCFQCGTCTGSCPSGRQTAFRIRKLIRWAQLGVPDKVLSSPDLWMCTTCYTCQERCPRGVEITDIVMTMRNIAVERGFMQKQHIRIGSILAKTGHLLPFKEEQMRMREALGLAGTPPTILSNKASQAIVLKIIDITGFKSLTDQGGK